MARRSNTITLILEGQKAIHSVDTFEQALHLFLRDDIKWADNVIRIATGK